MSCPCFKFAFTLTSGTAAIAADHGGQRKQFPDGPAYDDYYDLVVDIGDIGVENFADRVQRCLSFISGIRMATAPPIGVKNFGRAIVAGCVSRMLGIPEATTTWASRSPGN